MNIVQKLTVIAAVLILTLTGPAAFAQGDADTWEFSFAPYLWAVDLDGDMVVRGQAVEMDLDFDELLDEVEYGFVSMSVQQKRRSTS